MSDETVSSLASKTSLKCCRFTSLDAPLRVLMGRLGGLIGEKPLPFLLVPTLLVAALAYPFVSGFMDYKRLLLSRSGSIELFTPQNSKSSNTKRRMSELFPDGGYFLDRSFVAPNLLIVLVSAQDDSNMLLPEMVASYAKLRDDLERFIAVRMDGVDYDYAKICALDLFGTHCKPDPFVLLSKTHVQNFFSVPDITYPILNITVPTDSSFQQRSEYIGPLLGGVVTDDQNRVLYAKYIKMIFNFPPFPENRSADILIEYGKSWVSYVSDYGSPILNLVYWSAQKYTRDMSLISKRTIQLLPVLVGFLFLFSLGSCCMVDAVLSKPWLAVCGIVSAMAGIMCGYSVLLMSGVQLIEIAMIVPFLVLSIGVDDMFVMLNVWRKTPSHDRVKERLARTFRESGVSISVTTLTDAGVFAVGATSVFPAVRIFCVYSAVTIVSVFLFQLTFFGACMALTGARESARRHCVTFRRVKHPEKYDCDCIDCQRGTLGASAEQRSKPWPVLFFRDSYSRFLSKSMTQAVIGGTYLVYIGLATFCFVNRIQQGLQMSSLVPYDTDTYRYLEIYEKYFSRYSTAAEVMITAPVEYADPEVQESLFSLASALENSRFTMRADFWLREFLQILSQPIDDRDRFYHLLLHGFLHSEPFFRYAADIALLRADDGRYFINCSRFYVPLINMGYNNRSTVMRFLTDKVAKVEARTGVPLLVYDVSFPLAEQYDSIVPGIIQNVGVAGVGMLLIALLFIPCFKSCLAVSLTVISINVGVIGFLAAWNVHLDIISTITILLSIGFSVDFSSHITYHFCHSRGLSGMEKLVAALETVGWPILQSSFSTLVGVITVIGIKAYIAETFVKTVVLVIILGMYHGLFILPVLLTLLIDGASLCHIEKIYVDSQELSSAGRTDTTAGNSSSTTILPPPPLSPVVNQNSRVAVIKPTMMQPVEQQSPRKTYHRFAHERQQTVRVDTAWLDAWLHGDIACCAKKGKYCAYCTTREELEASVKEIKSRVGAHTDLHALTWEK